LDGIIADTANMIKLFKQRFLKDLTVTPAGDTMRHQSVQKLGD